MPRAIGLGVDSSHGMAFHDNSMYNFPQIEYINILINNDHKRHQGSQLAPQMALAT